MRRVLACFLGVGLSANGLLMLIVPARRYASLSSAPEIRPLKADIARDIAVAYLVAGVALVRFAMRQTGRSAERAGAAFLALQAAVRRWHSAARQDRAQLLSADATTIFLPPLLALAIPLTFALRQNATGEER